MPDFVSTVPMDVVKNEETLIEYVYVHLKEKTHPDGSTTNEKRVIRKKALKFELSNRGELLYHHKTSGKVRICVMGAGEPCILGRGNVSLLETVHKTYITSMCT